MRRRPFRALVFVGRNHAPRFSGGSEGSPAEPNSFNSLCPCFGCAPFAHLFTAEPNVNLQPVFRPTPVAAPFGDQGPHRSMASPRRWHGLAEAPPPSPLVPLLAPHAQRSPPRPWPCVRRFEMPRTCGAIPRNLFPGRPTCSEASDWEGTRPPWHPSRHTDCSGSGTAKVPRHPPPAQADRKVAPSCKTMDSRDPRTREGIVNPSNRATPWPRSVPSTHAKAIRSPSPTLIMKRRCRATAHSSDTAPSGSAANSGNTKPSGMARMTSAAR